MSQESIKVPVWFATLIVTAGIAWLGWVSVEIVGLKTDMSAVKEHLQITVSKQPSNELASQ